MYEIPTKIIECLPCILHELSQNIDPVNVEIFAQYIFSRISGRVLDAQKFDMSEKISH